MNLKLNPLATLFAFFTASQVSGQTERWINPTNYQTPVMKAIAYGITAPNPHNTQAWRIDTLSSHEMLLYAVANLPETDPPGRQVFLGVGCFIELLAVGMSGEGYETVVEYLPNGDYEIEHLKPGTKPVAKIMLKEKPGIQKNILFDYVFQRQSNRRPYKGKMISTSEFEAIKNLMGKTHSELIFLNDSKKMSPYLDIFYKAMEVETRNKVTSDETRLLFRFSEEQRREKRDGLSLAANGLEGLILKMAEKAMKNGDSLTWHSERMVKATMKNIGKAIYSSKALLFFKTNSNSKLDWILCGRDFARYNLAIARLGLATSHYNQVIQEYPEMQSLQDEFETLSNTSDTQKVQIIVRLGRAKPTQQSWRKKPEDFIMHNSSNK